MHSKAAFASRQQLAKMMIDINLPSKSNTKNSIVHLASMNRGNDNL